MSETTEGELPETEPDSAPETAPEPAATVDAAWPTGSTVMLLGSGELSRELALARFNGSAPT